MNDFTALDSQCAESAFAKLTAEENAEFQAWCLERAESALIAQDDDLRIACAAVAINCAAATAAQMEQAQRQCDQDDLRREFLPRGRWD